MRMFAGVALKCEGTIVVCEAGEDEGHVLIGWNSGDIYEQAVVKPVLSLSKERSRDFFAGIPHLYSASPGSGRQESTYEPAPVTVTRSRIPEFRGHYT